MTIRIEIDTLSAQRVEDIAEALRSVLDLLPEQHAMEVTT